MATQTTFEDIVRHLRSAGFRFGVGAGDRLALEVTGKHSTFNVQVYYPWEKEIIAFYAACPLAVPTSRTAQALELAARINWGLLFAVCEVEPGAGKIRFRATMPVDDAPFHSRQFDTLLATVCSLADRYLPAFRAVLEQGEPPEAAVEAVEAGDAD